MLFLGKFVDVNYQRIKYVIILIIVIDVVVCDDNVNIEFYLLVKNGNLNKLFLNNLCYFYIIRLFC